MGQEGWELREQESWLNNHADKNDTLQDKIQTNERDKHYDEQGTDKTEQKTEKGKQRKPSEDERNNNKKK